MQVNEVVVNGVTELSLVNDTVSEDTLLEGETAHDASGNQITGKFVPYNPNLLDNPDCSINQRGLSEYTDSGYIVDRWILGIVGSGNTGSYSPNTKMLVSNTVETNGYYVHLRQSIEKPSRLAGKVVTLSVAFKSTDNLCMIQVWKNSNEVTTVVAATSYNTELHKTLTLTVPEDITDDDILQFIIQTRGTSVLDWAKLEVGSVTTALVPPNPATELAKCQRYFQNYDIVSGGVYLIGVAQTAQVVKASVALPTTMRTTPTLIFDPEKWELFDGTTAHPITAIAIHTDSGRTQITFNITSSGLTVGKSYFLRAKTATNAAYSAEL